MKRTVTTALQLPRWCRRPTMTRPPVSLWLTLGAEKLVSDVNMFVLYPSVNVIAMEVTLSTVVSVTVLPSRTRYSNCCGQLAHIG